MELLKNIIKIYCPNFIKQIYNDYCSYKERQNKYYINSALIKTTFTNYSEIEKKLREKNKAKLRFASYVIFDSTFCAYGIMDLMISQNEKFDPKIVIIPDISRGQNHMIEQYNSTKTFFTEKYGNDCIIDGYDIQNNTFIDVSNQFDIIYCANPYDSIVNKVHSIKYLSAKNILPIYMSYGCYIDNYGKNYVMPLLEMSLFWKVFADNIITYKDYKKYELIKGKNVVLSGYAKMDEIEKYTNISSSDKKTIIIAPHHTINMPYLPLSNFLEYKDFILELPNKYPEIIFIFRPHPLLFTNMINEGYWTDEQKLLYIKELKNSGIIYSTGGDYLNIFKHSDALIHDCASFVAEYLFTGKPCCFVSKKNSKKYFSKLGRICLKNHYIAYNQKQIYDFIDKVVINKKDPLYKKRNEFANKTLKINYPNVSKFILDEITRMLKF